MGLELQVRGVTSAMPMNCAAAVTMAAGALQPACGCLISLILQHGTALCEVTRSAWAQVPVAVRVRQLRNMSDLHAVMATSDAGGALYTTAVAVLACHQCHCIWQASQQQLHQSTFYGRCDAHLSAFISSGPKA